MATEELLKLIQEDPMDYEGYLAYAKYLETINIILLVLSHPGMIYRNSLIEPIKQHLQLVVTMVIYIDLKN